MTRFWKFWYALTRGRMFDEAWAEKNRLMLQVRQLGHDLKHVTEDRDMLATRSLLRLRYVWQLEAEKRKLIDNNATLQGELFIWRAEALVREAERTVGGAS